LWAAILEIRRHWIGFVTFADKNAAAAVAPARLTHLQRQPLDLGRTPEYFEGRHEVMGRQEIRQRHIGGIPAIPRRRL